MQNSKKQDKERYRPRFSDDAEGLQKLICWLLTSRKVNRVKLFDETTAERLGVTIGRLRQLQVEVTEDGVILCKPATTRTWYSFAAIEHIAA